MNLALWAAASPGAEGTLFSFWLSAAHANNDRPKEQWHESTVDYFPT